MAEKKKEEKKAKPAAKKAATATATAAPKAKPAAKMAAPVSAAPPKTSLPLMRRPPFLFRLSRSQPLGPRR